MSGHQGQTLSGICVMLRVKDFIYDPASGMLGVGASLPQAQVKKMMKWMGPGSEPVIVITLSPAPSRAPNTECSIKIVIVL